jgi:hypothetical protein
LWPDDEQILWSAGRDVFESVSVASPSDSAGFDVEAGESCGLRRQQQDVIVVDQR